MFLHSFRSVFFSYFLFSLFCGFICFSYFFVFVVILVFLFSYKTGKQANFQKSEKKEFIVLLYFSLMSFVWLSGISNNNNQKSKNYNKRNLNDRILYFFILFVISRETWQYFCLFILFSFTFSQMQKKKARPWKNCCCGHLISTLRQKCGFS